MSTPASQYVLLVVDDDAASRDIAARLLEREGYTVRQAESGLACIELVQHERVDLVLLDVMMPGMDGFDVCTALRALDAARHIPIILLTAKDDTDTRLEGMHHGVSEFLTKPINRHELYARVRAQLHIIALAQQLETIEQNLKSGPPPKQPSSPTR